MSISSLDYLLIYRHKITQRNPSHVNGRSHYRIDREGTCSACLGINKAQTREQREKDQTEGEGERKLVDATEKSKVITLGKKEKKNKI